MRKYMLKAALTITLLLAAVLSAVSVSAEGNSYMVSFPVTVSNPNNNIPEDTTFTLIIEGQPHSPLPDPSEITAEVNGTYEFEPIEFTEPGNYKYTVKQVAPDDQKLIPDTKIYEIDVTVIRGENGDLEGGFTLSDNSDNGKPVSISFSNDYMKSSNSNTDDTSSDDTANINDADNQKTPSTGEPLSPAFGGLIMSGALFLLFLVVRNNRKNTEAESDE